ncbi:rabGTPase-activating protein [Naegleria gruberi]|uniref:RabGTPase-activating protein n=1 Tax=Naegleria gruberi TaxID=5762 RepID=D2VRU4_NAEGR|nr:rabGTPase-activating protein [Naegleria gruberi]EFC40524.1 rabGTPase-activating protein [Naegleria gruberi]|eukprot:XP_002673268.1 rabGTPase-activating protein [Naegleria gruberi strain NEG-M]
MDPNQTIMTEKPPLPCSTTGDEEGSPSILLINYNHQQHQQQEIINKKMNETKDEKINVMQMMIMNNVSDHRHVVDDGKEELSIGGEEQVIDCNTNNNNNCDSTIVVDKIVCSNNNNSTSTVQSESVVTCDEDSNGEKSITIVDTNSNVLVIATEEQVMDLGNASSEEEEDKHHDEEVLLTRHENQPELNIEKSVSIVEPEENVKQVEEEQVQANSSEKLDAESIIKVRERRISRRIVVNTNFHALTSSTTSSTETPVHNVEIFDDSEIENDTSTYSSDIDDDDGIISNVKDGYFEDSSSDLKGSDILSVKSSDTDGILVSSNGSVLKVNEAVNYYPSVNEISNTNASQPKIYSSIIFESKHDSKRIHLFESIASNYKEYVTKNPNQFRKLIREGIPTKESLKTIWKRMVGSEELSNKYPGLYKKLTMHDDILEDDVHKILKDVHRTYPQYEFFSEKDGPGQMSLIRILKAYCHFDKQTGYCQGMAFICGFALMNLEDEEDTFWFFVQIMNNGKHGLKDIFAEGLPRLRLIMFMVSELIKLRLPDIHKHLEENYILPEMYASSILMTLCTNRFSFASSQRIWSIFLNEGWKMLVRLMAGLMKLSKKEIIGANATEVTTKLYNTAEHVDIDIILKYSFSVRLTSRLMENLTLKYEEQELNAEEKKAAQQSRENLKKLTQLSSSPSTPRSGRSFSVSSIFAKISNLLGLLDSREDDAAIFKKNLT